MKYCFVHERDLDVFAEITDSTESWLKNDCLIFCAIDDNCVQGVFIYEWIEPRKAILHVVSYCTNPVIQWGDYYRDVVTPHMKQYLDIILIALNKEEKAKVRLFRRWGIPLKYNDEHSMYMAVQGL